ncbi:MAG: thiamine pyrophosphate-dependent dehydrogenase E1 component subunit alpha [Candidatus Humimicrobiaceae bacterium]
MQKNIYKENNYNFESVEILKSIGTQKALFMYQRILEIREFEERIKLLFLEGKMPGTIHQYIGQEACAVGVCSALAEDDVIASTHRPHGHAIARGIPLKELMAELYGKTTGCCKGKGGSMHLGDLDKGMLPAIAIVGGNIPIIMGMGLAFKLRGEKRVAVSFFGEGASNEGAFHEGINMAAVYKVPAVFVCENNQYGASTNRKLVMNIENIADRACAYGMRSDIGDGMNVLDVYQRAKAALEIARNGEGPTLLELKTFRLCGHSRRDPNNYMSTEEKDFWKKRDPIVLYEKFLVKQGILDNDMIVQIRKTVEDKIEEAVKFGQQSPEPAPEDTYNDLYINMEVPR